MDQGKTSELKSYPDLKYNLYSLHFKNNILNWLSDLYWMNNKKKSLFVINRDENASNRKLPKNKKYHV